MHVMRHKIPSRKLEGLEAHQERARNSSRIVWAVGVGLAMGASGLFTLWLLSQLVDAIF